MSPAVIVAGAGVLIVALIVGYRLLTSLLATRSQLIREQRAREDAARKADAGDPGWNIVASVFDPLGLFH